MTFASLFHALVVVISMAVMLVLAIAPRDKDGKILPPPKIFDYEADLYAGRRAVTILILLIATFAVALKVV